MEMSPKQLTLVLLTATVAVSVMVKSTQVTLDKTQKRVYVLSGSSLTLYCGLKTMNKERYRVSWFLNHSGSSSDNNKEGIFTEIFNKSTNTSREASNKIKQDLKDDSEETLPKYFLSHVTHNNSGWYFCEVTVEIPILNVTRSQGAEVVIMKTVKTVTEHTTYQSQVPVPAPSLLEKWKMWIILGVSSVILIVLLIVCVLLTRRLRGRRDSECPVYENMRRPSPRPGTPTDNLKMVPSSQNLRTPSPGRRYGEAQKARKHNQ